MFTFSVSGTLIGVFVTSSGILIGADSALWGPGVPPGTEIDKICQIGRASVATLQGWYGFEHAASGITAPLYQIFRATCAELADREGSLEAKADHLLSRLRSSLETFLRIVPPNESDPPFAGDPHVACISVASYEGSSPLVTVRGLGVLSARDGTWTPGVKVPVPGLGLTGCGVRFHGHDPVAYALMQDDARLPEGARRMPEVLIARQATSQSCADFNADVAKTVYLLAVKLTLEQGSRFGIPAGTVGGSLQLVLITPDGSIQTEVISEY